MYPERSTVGHAHGRPIVLVGGVVEGRTTRFHVNLATDPMLAIAPDLAGFDVSRLDHFVVEGRGG